MQLSLPLLLILFYEHLPIAILTHVSKRPFLRGMLWPLTVLRLCHTHELAENEHRLQFQIEPRMMCGSVKYNGVTLNKLLNVT